jgi:hypothetical protein
VDLATATDTQLTVLAARAFVLGLRDGRTLSSPRRGGAVIRDLTKSGDVWRNIHRVKLRQVYGAGFDIAKAKTHHTRDVG